MTSTKPYAEFSLLDYGVFVISLLLSLAVGLFYAIKPKTTDSGRAADFFMGNRKMPIIPTTLSMMASFMSGILLLALPAEAYERGIHIWLYSGIGNSISIIIAGVFFLPKVYKMRTVSIYAFLEDRFDSRALRWMGSGLATLLTLNYMAIVMYAPAVSLSAITGLKDWVFILSVGITCTFYTTIGGLRAVVWTDTIQAVLMYLGVFTLAVKGCLDVGGFTEVFKVSYEQERILTALNTNPSPLQYSSIWISLFGGSAYFLGAYSVSQVSMQRYCSLPSLNQARLLIVLLVPCVAIIGSVVIFYGLNMFVYFNKDCDPLSSGHLKTDQLVINFVTRTLASVPGFPGVFLASLCSGTLSTISSGINAMAAMTWEDFLRRPLQGRVSEEQTPLILKGLVLIYGVISIALAFACGPIGGILKAWMNILGSFAGPLTGLFVVAMFCPAANRRGTMVGMLVMMPILAWMTMGNIVTKPYKEYILPLNSCASSEPGSFNISAFQHNSIFGDESVFALYRVSPYLYSLIGIVSVYAVSLVASLLLPVKKNAVTPEIIVETVATTKI